MPAIIHQSDLWEHTRTEILNHDTKSEVGIITPTLVRQQPRQPNPKQISYSSCFLDPDNSPIKCTLCGKGGHN